MSSGFPLSLPVSLQRQLLRSAPRRQRSVMSQISRGFASTPIVPAAKRTLLPPDAGYSHTSPALSALLSRLSLPASADLQTTLQACLTHPSFLASAESTPEAEAESGDGHGNLPVGESNELLSALGNTLLGLYATEHLASLYPYLPTEALGQAVTAYVGSPACVSVARELGVAVTPAQTRAQFLAEQDPQDGNGNGNGKRARPKKRSFANVNDAGVPIRWKREAVVATELPVARRFRKYVKAEQEGGDGEGTPVAAGKRENWEHIVAGCVKAFVGLIYQEQGVHSARQFVHAHFLSRYLDMTSLFQFKKPKHVLSRAVAKHLMDRGISNAESHARIESRLLAETGRLTQSPIFSIGLFLPSGLKLSEAHGSSIAMAEHRAAVNALHSLYLVRSDAGADGLGSTWQSSAAGAAVAAGAGTRKQLPTETHGQWALESGLIGKGSTLQQSAISGGAEVVVESARR